MSEKTSGGTETVRNGKMAGGGMAGDTRAAVKLLIPFILTAIIIAADQGVKWFIASRYPIGPVRDVFGNDFLWIFHVRNKAIAFSLGDGLPDIVKKICFVLLPCAALVIILRFYFKSGEFTAIQRWAVAGVAGGGAGNLIDRIFRRDGVVDFISVKLYGFLGFERWPTFNIADAAVVTCVFLFIIGLFVQPPGAVPARTNAERSRA